MIAQLRKYDGMFNVYGTHFDIRWETLGQMSDLRSGAGTDAEHPRLLRQADEQRVKQEVQGIAGSSLVTESTATDQVQGKIFIKIIGRVQV